MLYIVISADSQIAYCSFKDRSLKNQAWKLFMPVLGTRPCFLDADGDGQFEATFSVFDKFGSMATPSGNLSKAEPLSAPIAYEQVDPNGAPQTMRIAFELGGGKQPESAKVLIKFDKAGRDRWEYFYGPTPRRETTVTAVNAEITVRAVEDRQASIAVKLHPEVLLTGSSGGTLTLAERPSFLK